MWIRLLPKNFTNSPNKFDSNCRPLSMVIIARMPKQDTQPAMNIFTVVWASMLAMRRTKHQKEKRLTHVNKYVYPSQGSKRPVMCSNRSSGDGKGSTGFRMYLPILAFWHCSQVLAHSWISSFIWGHTYLSDISLMEAFASGWDRLWRLEKKICRNDSGTNGHIFPILSRLLFGTRIFVNFRKVELSWSRFWRIWSLSCSFTNSVMSVHGSKKRHSLF